MKDPLDIVERSQVPLAERTPDELVNLIKKLRWIGLEEEAARIQTLLRRTNAAVTLLAGLVIQYAEFEVLSNRWCH